MLFPSSSPFFPHSIPASSSSSTSPSLLISVLLTFRCCHANFPGDSVVMETGQRGRSADVWCCSGVCRNHSPVFALILLPRPFFWCSCSSDRLTVTVEPCEQTRLFFKNEMVLKVAFLTGTTLVSFLPLHYCCGTRHVFIRLVIHCCHEKTQRGHYSNISWQPYHIRAFGTKVAHL